LIDSFRKKTKSYKGDDVKSRTISIKSNATKVDDWSQEVKSIANQNLKLDILQNMERRRTLATEHQHRRGKLDKDDPKHPLAVTQSELDRNEETI